MLSRLSRRGSAIAFSVLSRAYSNTPKGLAKTKHGLHTKPKQHGNSPPAAHTKLGKHIQSKSSATVPALAGSQLKLPKKQDNYKKQQHQGPTNKQERQNQQEEDEIDDARSSGRDDVFLPPGAVSATGLRRLACSNIFVGTTSTPSHIENAEFVKSSVRVQDCPKGDLPEFAFVGRSNVGKSSLINTLAHKRQLAKTSKTPGKTQVINHFSIDKSWYIVDLPGYGFARAPTDIRVSWDNFTRDYFLKRETLVSVLLLVDASVSPKKSDIGYANWLASNKIPFTLVFTKCDKRRSRNKLAAQNNVLEFLKSLKDNVEETPPWVMTSCVNRQGTNELLTHLAHLRDYWQKRPNSELSTK